MIELSHEMHVYERPSGARLSSEQTSRKALSAAAVILVFQLILHLDRMGKLRPSYDIYSNDIAFSDLESNAVRIKRGNAIAVHATRRAIFLADVFES